MHRYTQVLLYLIYWSAVMFMISWPLNEQSDYESNLQAVFLFTLFVYGGEILRSPINVVYCTAGRFSMEIGCS